MITDQETNFVYISSLITERPELTEFWQQLERVLQHYDIPFGLIGNTNDIWCRDYMPLQVALNELVQFNYSPSYCNHAKWRHLITDPAQVTLSPEIAATTHLASLVLDGGNVVRSGKAAVLTDRIFKENAGNQEYILQQIQQLLQVEELHILPAQPYEMTGHVDGMVRFLDDDTLLVADYHTQSMSWKARYEKALQRTGLQLIPFPNVLSDICNKDKAYTAIGCYINFAWIGKVILFPQFDIPEDKAALQEACRIFKGYTVTPVPARALAMDGGVLNCVTWNIRV